MEPETKKLNLSVPLAIIVAGLFVASAIALTRSPAMFPTESKLKPITASDHILGNPDAPVKVIEFSDTECPFCKQFQATMHRIMNVYGKDGRVAWVYRQYPIAEIHPKALKEAEATECAGELGGNAAFWAYLDTIFEVTPSNDNLDPAELFTIAQTIGLDRLKFESCLASGKYTAHVAENIQEAISVGAEGTPWTIVVAANGKLYPLAGGQPYAAVKSLIDVALQQK